MKSILISIKPLWVSKILNGEKTVEIRKSAPKCELPATVYIYCTKDSKHKLEYCDINKGCWSANDGGDYYNGKVVAKFTLNKVEEIAKMEKVIMGAVSQYEIDVFSTETMSPIELLNRSLVHSKDLSDYLNGKNGYAWHIDDLEIFEEPKELVGKAPQSWRYEEEGK